jgi:hypothetical protein
MMNYLPIWCRRNASILCISSSFLNVVTCRMGRVTKIMGSGSDDWIYWCFFTITLSYNQYSAIADLHAFRFIVAHALEYSVSTSRILATDLHTGTITWNHYEVFLSFLLQSPWTAISPILSLQYPWFLTVYSSVLISTQLQTHSLHIDAARTTHKNYASAIVACVSFEVPTWSLPSQSIGPLAAA